MNPTIAHWIEDNPRLFFFLLMAVVQVTGNWFQVHIHHHDDKDDDE